MRPPAMVSATPRVSIASGAVVAGRIGSGAVTSGSIASGATLSINAVQSTITVSGAGTVDILGTAMFFEAAKPFLVESDAAAIVQIATITVADLVQPQFDSLRLILTLNTVRVFPEHAE